MRATNAYVHVYCNRAAWCVLPLDHDGDCDVKARSTTLTTTHGYAPGWIVDATGMRYMTLDEKRQFDKMSRADAKPLKAPLKKYPKIRAVSEQRDPSRWQRFWNHLVRIVNFPNAPKTRRPEDHD